MDSYGKEVILDIHNCDASTFTREGIENYLKDLCDKIDMERFDLHWWQYTREDTQEPHLIGISAVQFIRTSTIVIHTLEEMKRVYLNIFSCKDFDENVAIDFSISTFGGEIVNQHVMLRI